MFRVNSSRAACRARNSPPYLSRKQLRICKTSPILTPGFWVSRERSITRYLLNDRTTRGVGLYSGEDCVGYAYVSTGGHIGPLAVARPDALGSAFRTALALAVEIGSPQVSAFLPGASEAALRTAVEHGMRITFPMLLMSTRDFGDWSGYLPRNPGFMWRK